MKPLIILWIESSMGIPTMSTEHSFPTREDCQKEINRLEAKYYPRHNPHKQAGDGETYHMECLTHEEVIRRLQGYTFDKVY